MERLRREDGMTLVEMLVAIVIGMIVVLAGLTLLEITMKRTGLTNDRVEATQSGRMAMDTITREVRSQVCALRTDATMPAQRAVFAATATSVTFFVDLSDGTANPQLRTLSFENNQLIERDYNGTLDAGTSGLTATYKYSGYPAAPTLTHTLLSNVKPGLYGAGTYFEYFGYTPGTALLDDQLTPGPTMDAPSLSSIAKISVSYTAVARRSDPNNPNEPGVLFTDDVFVRSADPNSATPRPMCE